MSIKKSRNEFERTQFNGELVWPKIEAPLGKSQHFLCNEIT
jgi:hypothetical protein